MEGNQNYYCVIPTQLIECGKPLKALLYGVIISYTRKNGKCWATNKTLAGKIGIKSDKTVSRYIQELIKENWICSEIVITEGNQRYLSIGSATTGTRSGTTKHEGSGTTKHEGSGTTKHEGSGTTKHTSIISKSIKKSNIYNTCKLSDDNSLITKVIKIFTKINPTLNYGNKTQRKAVSELAKKIGNEKTLKSAEYAVNIQGEQYAPLITTPLQLKNKISQLVIYWQKRKAEDEPTNINLNEISN